MWGAGAILIGYILSLIYSFVDTHPFCAWIVRSRRGKIIPSLESLIPQKWLDKLNALSFQIKLPGVEWSKFLGPSISNSLTWIVRPMFCMGLNI